MIKHVLLFAVAFSVSAAEKRSADVVIYGATSAGVAAAVQAARMGKSVLLIDPGTHIGGLTTGGLSWTDIGNKVVIGGVSREFYQRIKKKYDDPARWKWEKPDQYYRDDRAERMRPVDAMWTFEPHVASEVYAEMLAEAKVQVLTKLRLDLRNGVRKRGNRIATIVTEGGAEYSGKMFIDATYEGDLMAKAGVKYTIGRESNAQYGENYNGSQAPHRHQHQFPDGALVSPYVVPGDPKSGLLPIIDPNGPGEIGIGDKRIQAYCFRMCLSRIPENRIAIEKPAGYDERDHELLLRFAETGKYHNPSSKYDPIPNGKTDTNNHGAVSTDYMGANWEYPEGDYATRERIIKRHEVYQKGYMWTLQNHPRVPEKLREYYRQWGLPKDDFTSNGGWPTQLYIREARRMVSDVVMTESHIIAKQYAKDSVGMGAYGMDSHNVQRYVTKEGWVRNEGNVQVGGFVPYPISYRSIVPRKGDAENLLVPICLSASHIAYGSIRMEPVFMVLGQSAATAAAQAIDGKLSVQAVDYAKLRARLLEDKQILELPAGFKRPEGIDRGKLEGIVLDDKDATMHGDWRASRASSPFLGPEYFHDGNTHDGKTRADFTVGVPKAGRYKLRLLYPAHENRASNTPVTINGTTVRINQKNAGEWIGPFQLPRSFTVTVGNEGANGYVVIDGVQVVEVKP
ncbi:MAG: FAD-dependent oxidoreductase [Acidobacteria bacterium]|nr:FAD-dependent oxidoreductase [Acidobacteriota bacterium]